MVLLGQRKRGHVNMRGKWNGFGGKVESGEDILEAAIREVKEECGIIVNPSNVRRVGQFTGNMTRSFESILVILTHKKRFVLYSTHFGCGAL